MKTNKNFFFFLLILIIIGIIGVIKIANPNAYILAQEQTSDESSTIEEPADIQEDENITTADLQIKEPKLLPDSKLYFIKSFQNKLKLLFAFNPVKKAELNLKIASEKLWEAKKLAEKTAKPEILENAISIYNEQMKKFQQNIAQFQGTATSSEKISKFLDKYAKQQILHNQILEKLETKVPTSTLEIIRENRERHLKKFGEVMQKLEDKTKIQNRLEGILNNLKPTELREIINLKIINNLQNNFPSSTQDQLQKVKDDILRKIQVKAPSLTPQQQQRVQNYLENIQEKIETRLKIINEIKENLPATSTIKHKIEEIKERIENLATTSPTTNSRRWGKECVCTEQYNPVCGADGKTYGNSCKAECQNIAIVSQGPCDGKTDN